MNDVTKTEILARLVSRESVLSRFSKRSLTRMKKGDLETLLREVVAAEEAAKRAPRRGKVYGEPFAQRNGRRRVHILGADGTEIAYVSAEGAEILAAVAAGEEISEEVDLAASRVRTLIDGDPSDWFKHGRLDEIAVALGALAASEAEGAEVA